MTTDKILVINAGSSSIKFQVYDEKEAVLAKGLCERIFVDGSFEIEANGKKLSKKVDFPDHEAAFKCILDHLLSLKIISNLNEIKGAGHRIVQGASYFKSSVFVDQKALNKIVEYSALAPLHNKAESDVIKVVMKLVPAASNVAVFDTTFHATMPAKNYKYAVPQEWETKYLVRRYGFHGTSYRYITDRMEKHLKKSKVNLIVCHLGNGASICAIKDSQSYNTSMGFTPLEGLVMGSRSGDIDPSVVEYVMACTKMSANDLVNKLNKASGLLGLTGSSDMRDVEANAKNNIVALEMYASRIADYIVKYWNQLKAKVDAIVFTAGVGENSKPSLLRISQELGGLKISLNEKAFDEKYSDLRLVSDKKSPIPVYQVRTNEELMILRDVKTFGKLKNVKKSK
ncbi:acetate kinase [[Mycoplasma] testudinis]|uniref:acetate kinase n=1 Tax=[Mycoplasma] testudinis TaxID=33924 RepID=UPI0004840AD8|nr:acetate kinase [[Mycoplasma] testudinis]